MRKFNNFLNLLNNLDDEHKNLALTHSSYANDNKIESNERLEFLGDSVLGLIVSEFLFKHYKQAEGKLSKARAELVCTTNLSKLAKEMQLGNLLRLGKSFNNKPISDAMLADLVESIIGAFYLCYSKSQIKAAIYEMLDIKQYINAGAVSHDYKSQLQETVHKLKMNARYNCETFLTKSKQTNFKCTITINSIFYAYGKASTKRQAEQNAAKVALKKLEKNKV